MTDFPVLSRLYRHQLVYRHRLGGRRAPRLATAVILAGSAILAAGCGTKSAGAAPQTPQQAVDAAARQAAQIRSAAATVTEVLGGPGDTISGTVVEQLKPTLLLSMTLNVTSGGAAETLGGIITSKAIYVHSSAVPQSAGRQWIEIPFSVLNGSGSSLAQLFKSLSKINPARQAEVFAAARNVRKAGTQVIDGVQATRYSGTVLPSAALAVLPPSLRKALAPALKEDTGDIRFNMWIDAQGHVRKLLDTQTVNGQTITTTVVFSAINQPVHITVPAPSQVEKVPASALAGNAT